MTRPQCDQEISQPTQRLALCYSKLSFLKLNL